MYKYSINTIRVRSLLACLLSGFLLLSSGSLWAGAVSADFRENLALPAFCVGDRVLESLGQAIGVGNELDETDESANPCSWNDSLLVDYDPVTNLLSLTPSSQNTYQIIDINLTSMIFDLIGETVTGSVEVSDNVMSGASDPFTRQISTTVDSISISYSANDIPGGTYFEFDPQGAAIFQIELSSATPLLPALGIPTLSQTALALLMLLLFGLSMWRIKKFNLS